MKNMNYLGTVTIACIFLLSFTGFVWADNGLLPFRPIMKNESGSHGERVNRVLTVEDNGSEIDVNVGETFSVDLKVSGGTGYNWYPDLSDESHLKLINVKTTDKSSEKITGGPVLGSWRFEALAPGDARLRMLYYRVWEGKEKSIKKFEIIIHISDKR